jgi:coproporphyrinogen III oxidase-like Fe-S oxidoreductase
MSWMKEFKTKWKEYIDLPFHCQIRLDSINDEKLNILKSAGCTGVSVGIECANESYRINYLNRKLSNYKIIEKCNLIKSKGLKLRAYVMIGLPFTTIDDDLDTLSFIHNIQPTSVRSAIYYPLKGTVLGNSCYESNLISIDRVKSIEKLPFNNLSVLNFNNDRLTQIQFLQKLFQLFVFIPEPVKLFKSIFENSKDISSNDMNINNIADFSEFLKRHLYDNILYA